MGMSNDLPALQRLRRGIIRDIRIRKASSNEVINLDLDFERLIRGHIRTWGWTDDDGRDHVGGGRNIAHNDAVAGPGGHLFPVHKPLALTMVDEVGGVGFGSRLPGFDDVALSIALGCGLDVGGVEGELSSSLIVVVVRVVLVVGVSVSLVRGVPVLGGCQLAVKQKYERRRYLPVEVQVLARGGLWHGLNRYSSTKAQLRLPREISVEP